MRCYVTDAASDRACAYQHSTALVHTGYGIAAQFERCKCCKIGDADWGLTVWPVSGSKFGNKNFQTNQYNITETAA